MKVERALEILRERFEVPRTESNRNLSYDQVQLRKAFGVIEEALRGRVPREDDN